MDLQELDNWATDASQTDRKDLARLGFDSWKKNDRNVIPRLSKLLRKMMSWVSVFCNLHLGKAWGCRYPHFIDGKSDAQRPDDLELVWLGGTRSPLSTLISHVGYFLLDLGCLLTESCPILLRPHGLYFARLLSPWDSPGKNTGAGGHLLLQGIF